jgi:hypothetical protein
MKKRKRTPGNKEIFQKLLQRNNIYRMVGKLGFAKRLLGLPSVY